MVTVGVGIKKMETIHSSFPFPMEFMNGPGPMLWLYLMLGLMLIIAVAQIAFLAKIRSRRVLAWLCPACSLAVLAIVALAFAGVANNLHWDIAPVLLTVLALSSLADIGSTIFPAFRARDLAFAAFSPITAVCYYMFLVLLVQATGASGAA